MKPITTQLGGLVARVFPETAELRGALVLCHGFGAPGTDLVGIGPELVRLRAEVGEHVRLVFPEAPLDLGPMFFGGRAWWHIDVGRFMAARTVEDAKALMAAEPAGLKEARRLLRGLVEELLKDPHLSTEKIVLGGFSQGAMLATDVALHLEEAPGALVVFSGALVAQSTWVPRAKARRGLLVVQTHGREDAVLPFFVGEALKEELEAAGLDVRFRAFRGPHTIDEQGVRDLADLLAERLAKGSDEVR